MPGHRVHRQSVFWVAPIACAILLLPARADAEPAAEFYQGKQVRFYTMGSPGGGYDTYMRALVPHLERKIGAKMVPTNEPAAGGLIRRPGVRFPITVS